VHGVGFRRLPFAATSGRGPDNKARRGRGTEGSNPSPSSNESAANLFLGRATTRRSPPSAFATSAYRFQPELLALAKYPNVAVKATGQAGYAEDEYPFRSLHPHLHRCFDAFGPERMFWGTDITRMPCSWRQCVTLFTEELPWLKGRDLDLVMGEALCNWIGWPLAAGARS